MTTPEQRARKNIDDLLTACGWMVQSRDQMNLGAARGVAVREFPMKERGHPALSSGIRARQRRALRPNSSGHGSAPSSRRP